MRGELEIRILRKFLKHKKPRPFPTISPQEKVADWRVAPKHMRALRGGTKRRKRKNFGNGSNFSKTIRRPLNGRCAILAMTENVLVIVFLRNKTIGKLAFGPAEINFTILPVPVPLFLPCRAAMTITRYATAGNRPTDQELGELESAETKGVPTVACLAPNMEKLKELLI